MKKFYTLICAATLVLGVSAQGAHAAKPVTCKDTDGDGYGNPGVSVCPNGSATDCNNSNSSIYPGAPEICGDGIDQDCNGSDLACGNNPHASLTYAGYPSNCISCHDGGTGGSQYNQMFSALHYTWKATAPDMTNQPGTVQGKLTNELNSYCINILGNWPSCGACHAGRGIKPGSGDTKANIDCLICHNAEYATQRVRLADGSMGVLTPTDTMVRNIAKPTRANCLACHAKAGGDDGVKRGTLSMATVTNTSATFDVHMNTTGTNLACQACHTFVNHKVTGKGSDLRPTDYASEVKCTTCHTTKASPTGHTTATNNRHVARVACQSCHIATYAKTATETHRDWTRRSDGTPADGVSGPGHPFTVKAANLIPQYLMWDRTSNNMLLGDNANLTKDVAKNTYPTSRPNGNVQTGKLYPFKYKTSYQPIARGGSCDGQIIALDTWEYLKVSGNVNTAITKGLANMGCTGAAVEWINTDTYQLINHGVTPSANATTCVQCHGSLRTALNLTSLSMLDKVGYALKDTQAKICSQCHGSKTPKTHESMHNHINKGSGIDCLFCHTFTRPERGDCSPCDPACVSEFVDTTPYPHVCN